MKIAILGGTHGNEVVGIEVLEILKRRNPSGLYHEYCTFLANPMARQQGTRFVASDLNRAFGKKGQAEGYELARSQELKDEIEGKYDFIIDLHTTTTNMGLTIILNHDSLPTIKAACYLQEKYPELKIIKAKNNAPDCPYIGAMAPAGLTIEVGPVANNVIKASLVLTVYEMVTSLLAWDFHQEFNYSELEYYQTQDDIKFPEGHWYLHPSLEGKDFELIKPGDPLFINIEKEVINYQGDEPFYPFFINEAAYQKDNIAMSTSVKLRGMTPKV